MDFIEEAGKDLSMMHIDESKPFKDVTNVSQSSLSGDASEKYKKLMVQAKRQAAEGHAKQALDTLQRAVKLNSNDKILKKIAKLEAFIKEYGQSSEEEDDAMMHVGKGFYLNRDLYDKLYPHQKEGILWFWRLHRKKKGGILGDDMGLGKTIQVISFLSGLFDANEVHSVMIILPVALIINWERELEKWAPGIRVETFHTESKNQRQRALDKVQRRGGVLLISYGLVVTNCDKLKMHNYRQFTWDYVILDEGHKIKNPTKTTKAVHAISAHHRFILTGTPVQNNLKELWSLFDFVCQGTLLGTRQTFCAMYENPIIRAREKCGTGSEKRLGNEMAESLRRLIAPHFLRRTKAEVKKAKQSQDGNPDAVDGHRGIQMPTLTRKNDLIVWMHLSQTQIQIYQEFLSLDRVKELLMTTRSPLVELTILKKICDHPRLLSTLACQQLGLAGITDSMDVDESQQKECAANLVNHIPDELLLQESGKLQFLMGLLEKLHCEGHRTLVFSQSRKMLDVIQKLLWSRDIKFLRLDGTIRKLEEREKLIKSFQENDVYSVFLLTTQVGGVGLTLTAADRVVVFDPHWNPATDNQAVDRVYRIGQTRSVVIYRLITCGSVEEKIYRRQIFKDSITRQTTGDTKNPYRYFTRQELHELFVLDDPQVSTTQQQLEELHTGHRITDPTLDDHIAYLYSLGIFGLSDHDLMFSQEAVQETAESHANESTYIHETVQKAQTLVANECQLTQQIKEHYSGQNEDDGQENQQSTGQYRDRFSLMNQLSRMQGVEVPEPPPRSRAPPPPRSRAPPPPVVPTHHPYGRNIGEVDMVDVDLDAEEISEEDLNKTMESLTLKDYKEDQNTTQEMIDADEVIDLTDDSYISTDSTNNHQTDSGNRNHDSAQHDDRVHPQTSPKMEFIDLTEEKLNVSIQRMHHDSNSGSMPTRRSVEDNNGTLSYRWSPTNLHEGNTEKNVSELSSIAACKREELDVEDTLNSDQSGVAKDDQFNNASDASDASCRSTASPSDTQILSTDSTESLEDKYPQTNVTSSSEIGEDNSDTLILPSDISIKRFPASVECNLLKSKKSLSAQNSPAAFRNYVVEDSDVSDLFQDSTVSEASNLEAACVVEESDEEDYASTAGSSDANTASQDDQTVNESLVEMDTSHQNIETSESEADDNPEQELMPKRYLGVQELAPSGLDSPHHHQQKASGRFDKNDGSLEESIMETEEEADIGSATEGEEEEEEVDEQEEEEAVDGEMERKEKDLSEDENECVGDDVGDETRSDDEDGGEADNSMDEFINDDENEEGEEVSTDDENEYDSDEEEEDNPSEEEDDAEYLQLVKEGRNQEKSGNMKKALKCYLQALEIQSNDRSLQLYAYKLAHTLKKSQRNNQL